VQQLETDPPENAVPERSPAPTIDWQQLFEIGQFDQAEIEYLLLAKIGGFSREEVAQRMNWSPKELNRIEVASFRRLKRIKRLLDKFMTDFAGGSSRKLWFVHQLPSGKLGNRHQLTSNFDALMSGERKYLAKKNLLKTVKNGKFD